MTRRLLAVITLAAIPGLASAQDKPTGQADVVVTGRRLQDTEAALKACLAQHCPPDKDIAATLAHAENLFVAGDYHNARQTLQAGVGRDKRFARQYPVQVSDLLRANSRIAAHLGESESYRIGAVDVVSALKAGLPDNDARVLVAQIELGDAYAKTRQIEAALDTYKGVAAHAHTLDLPTVEGHARLRQAIFLYTLSTANPATYARDAQHAADDLIAETRPQLAAFALAAKLLKAQNAARQGDSAAIDRLVAEYRAAGGGVKPVLLYAPKIQGLEKSDRMTNGGSVTNQMAVGNFDDQWVDVSFWIAPNGYVTDASVLRQSPKLSGYWVQPIVTSVSGRRYAPLKMDPSEPGLLRVERYTFTSHWTEVVGSHLRQREPVPQIEMIDLSRDEPTKG